MEKQIKLIRRIIFDWARLPPGYADKIYNESLFVNVIPFLEGFLDSDSEIWFPGTNLILEFLKKHIDSKRPNYEIHMEQYSLTDNILYPATIQCLRTFFLIKVIT